MNLEISDLGKQYDHTLWGLRHFSLSIRAGVLGLLGPNGAGKTTLMRILTTVTQPTEGQVLWDAQDITQFPDAVRRDLGYLPQDFGIYPNLNAVEFLTYLAAARGISGRAARTRIDQMLELVNMGEFRKRRLGSLSGGMKQRVGIAQALLNDPRLLIVDEPTAGLDPEERIRFRNLLSELSTDRIVILSSHIVSDIETVAGSIAIINHGQLLSHATPEELLGQVTDKTWTATVDARQIDRIESTHIVSHSVRTAQGVRVRLIGDNEPAEEARPIAPTLEDAYLYQLAVARRDTRHA